MLRILKPLTDTLFVKKYPSGMAIYFQSEVPRQAAILLSGVIKVYSISSEGEEQIVTLHVPGEFFPSSWIFGKSISSLFFYESLSDCEIAYVDRSVLINHMLKNDTAMHALLDYFTTNYSASLIRINALEQSRARDKLIYTLYFLCMRYGKKSNSKTVIPFSLTHQLLANFVGITRETAAIEMNKLKKERILTYDKQSYTVDMSKLFAVIGEDSFKDISIIQKN